MDVKSICCPGLVFQQVMRITGGNYLHTGIEGVRNGNHRRMKLPGTVLPAIGPVDDDGGLTGIVFR